MPHDKTRRRRGGTLLLLAWLFNLFFTAPPPAAAAPSRKPAPVVSADSKAESTNPTLEKERKIGEKALAEIEKRWPLTTDPTVLARLRMILNRLTPYMERRIPYELYLVKSEAFNAFCLPGGFIFFTTGILDLLRTDSEIAAVMAHEMIHADRSHSLKMAAKTNALSLAALAALLLSGGATAPIVLTQVAQVTITNAYSIEFEKEADSMGLDALIAAGYSPGGMVTLMEKFMNEELKQPIRDYGIYMDHPESKERLQAVLDTLKLRGIRVERKHSLGLLRTAFQETHKRIELTVDGYAVWGGKKTQAVRTSLEETRTALDKYFQMETAPYDLRLEGDALYIGNRILARKGKGLDSLPLFRERLLTALDRARRQHPMGKYFH